MQVSPQPKTVSRSDHCALYPIARIGDDFEGRAGVPSPKHAEAAMLLCSLPEEDEGQLRFADHFYSLPNEIFIRNKICTESRSHRQQLDKRLTAQQ